MQFLGIQRRFLKTQYWALGLYETWRQFNDLSICQISKETSSACRLLTYEEDVMAE